MNYLKQIAIFSTSFFISYYFISCTPCSEKQEEEVRKYNKDTALMYRWISVARVDSTVYIYEYRPNGDIYYGQKIKINNLYTGLNKDVDIWYSDNGNYYTAGCAQGNLETSLVFTYQIINDTLIQDNARKYYKLFKLK